MPKSDCSASLELPVVEVKSRLFGRSPPTETIANAATGEESGLFCWGELKPEFLSMNLINGIGELAL